VSVAATIHQQAKAGAAHSLTHAARHSGGPAGAGCDAPSPVNGGPHRELREVPATDQAIRADRPRLVLSAARPADVSGSAPATGRVRMPASREGD